MKEEEARKTAGVGMKVLGVVASYRRQGNSEVLVKEALMGAEEEGASVDILRLTNHRIESCRGCGRCDWGRKPCHLQDDFNYILDRMYQSDGIILGAPCYYIGSPGILKMFIDRTVSTALSTERPIELYGKPGVTIIPYANRGYTAYAFVLPNLLFHKWGMKVIDQALIQCTGAGDAMINNKALSRAHNMGKSVARAIKTGDMTYQGEKGICPVCHDRILRILRDMESVQCPTCGIRGKVNLMGNKIEVSFTEADIERGRYSAEQWYMHHAYHVDAAQQVSLQTKEERKREREKYAAYLKVD